jgi:hypothetical protein
LTRGATYSSTVLLHLILYLRSVLAMSNHVDAFHIEDHLPDRSPTVSKVIQNTLCDVLMIQRRGLVCYTPSGCLMMNIPRCQHQLHVLAELLIKRRSACLN